MKKLFIKDVLEKVKGEVLCGNIDKEIIKVSKDTRNIEKGDTYIALKGENVDGNIFCKDAIEKGATICFVQDCLFTPEELKKLENNVTIIKVEDTKQTLVEMAKIKRSLYDIPVIAITGSVGKTSTKDVIAKVMEEKYNVHKTDGNMNNELGVSLTIMGLKQHNALVIEIGMNHQGEIRKLTNIVKPTLAIITNIGTSHIGNLGSRENILKAKLEILEGMENGKIIINNDNDLLNKWNLEDKKENKITFGIESKSDYNAKNIKVNENNNEFEIEIEGKNYKFKTSKPGLPFILNALSAIAVGREYNIPIEKIQTAIQTAELTKNRMEIEKINGVTIIKDYYNASFESIKPSLEYLANLEKGKKIAVLGDIKEVGDFAKELHEKVGEEVSKNKIDILITVGKDAEYIAQKAVKTGMTKEKVFVCKTNLQAIKKLKEIIRSEDKILLKASNSMKFGEIFEGLKRKIKVAVIVGGMSSEHDVSLMSGKSILEKINKDKYDIKVIYIKKNGNTYKYTGPYENITKPEVQYLIPEANIIDSIKEVDVVFPVLHGKFGEDGNMQGLLEITKKAYVGCKTFTSSACMDKEFTKKIIQSTGIQVAKGIVVKKQKEIYIINNEEKEKDIKKLCEKCEKYLNYPMFVKPSREGSSFGVSRAENRKELEEAIEKASNYDNKVLIEEEIKGRELECAIIGNEEILSSEVGEIKSAEQFYTYDAKYNNPKSETVIPAKIEKSIREKIKKYAEKAFIAVDGSGLARIDFFLKENGEIILNEINTMPGFTQISMYPKLFESIGIDYSELIDKLIDLAIDM